MKIKRKFNWEELLGEKAWLAQELADKLGMHIMTLRRYLRFAVNTRVLVEKQYGRYKYYVYRKTWEKYCKERGIGSET